jgi:hypothetical protein
MEQEIDNLSRLASRFITVESSQRVIPNWKRDLSIFRSAPSGTKMAWKIPEGGPIETEISYGDYEPGDRNGELAVFGRVSGVWEIQLPEELKKRYGPHKEFVLLGLASVKISIWDAMEDPFKEIARWTIEVGDAVSPGCHFHIQIDLDPEDNKFPKSLSVPRLPGILLTPMDALEYLLGELFQDRWLQVASEGRDHVRTWANCQKTRLLNLLEWQKKEITRASGSPWAIFKKQKPALNMLIGTE